jgi:hypothetical protein
VNGTEGHSRATSFAVLLLPAIALASYSWWFFAAKWIGVAVLAVGVLIATKASTRPLKTMGLVTLVVVEVGVLISTAVVGVAIDCARNCS